MKSCGTGTPKRHNDSFEKDSGGRRCRLASFDITEDAKRAAIRNEPNFPHFGLFDVFSVYMGVPWPLQIRVIFFFLFSKNT